MTRSHPNATASKLDKECVQMDSIERSRVAARSLIVVTMALLALRASAQLDLSPEPQPPQPQSAKPEPVPEPVPEPAEPAATRTAARKLDADDANTITIVGSRISETAGSAHIISDKKLQRFEYDDPTAILLSIPGVYARGEDGVGMRNNIGLRGVNPDRSKKVTLLEDGVLFAPAPYSAPAAYYFPLITRMTGIEVVKGPAAISHGPYTIAGAIDVRTREVPIDESAMLDVGAGQWGYGKAHLYAGGTTDDNLGFLIEGVHLRNTGFKHLPNGGETGSVRNEWMGKLAYELDRGASVGNRFGLKLTYSDEDSDETYLGLTDEDFREDPLQRYAASQLDNMRAHRVSAVLTHELTFSPTASLTTNVYHHHYYRSWRRAKNFGAASLYDPLVDPTNPDFVTYANILRGILASEEENEAQFLYIGPNERDFNSEGIDTRLRAQLSTGPLAHRIEAGARLHHDSVERRHSETAYYVGDMLRLAGRPTVTSTFEQVDALAFSLHAADAVTWGPLTLTPGVRAEFVQFTVDNHLFPPSQGQATTSMYEILPGVGAFVSLFQGFGVLGGISRGFSPPAPPTRPLAADQNLALVPLDEPELSINYELGARYMHEASRAEAIAFFNDYSNLTDICTASSGCTEMNLDRQFSAGAARIYGLEAFVEHVLPVGAVRVPLSASYTYTHGEFRNDFSSEDPIFGTVVAGDYMPYLPEHQLRATIAAESEYLDGELGVMYMSPMREKAGQEPVDQSPVKTDEQLLFDVGFTVHVNEWWSIYANLRNVFDAHHIVGHRPLGARPNAPRWFQAGTKLTY
jgi:Fe(3+) dicitrate transport protein